MAYDLLVFAVVTFIGYSWKNNFWTALGYVMVGLLAAQVVSPLFVPKISVSDTNVTVEIIDARINGGKTLVFSQFEVRVRPPLFPIVRSISIPAHHVGDCHISPNRASDAHKAAMNSRLFSYDFTNPNEIKFNISTDANGWAYDELKTKIEYCAYSDIPPMFEIDDKVDINQSTLTAPVQLRNYEMAPLYFDTFYKDIEVKATLPDDRYCIDWCDKQPQSNLNCSTPIAGCLPFTNISTDGGKTFTTEKLTYNLNSTSSFKIHAPVKGEVKDAGTTTIGYIVVRSAECKNFDLELFSQYNISWPWSYCCYRGQTQECVKV